MQNLYDLDTPTLLIDLDRLERNIRDMAEIARAGGKALRPHTKTHKTPEIARMQLAAGASGLTVAKLGEAEAMAAAGLDDLFIANQIVGAPKVARLLELLKRTRVRVGVDSREVAEPIGTAAQAQNRRVSVLIEVDTGLGRAGARSPEETLELARWIAEQPGLEFVGVFTHEGHLYRAPNAEARVRLAGEIAADARTLSEALRSQGTPAREISFGSTPGASLLAHEAGITELRPGVYVVYDRMQVKLGTEPERCALSVLATVTSVRSDGRIIVDAGTKTMASDCPFEDKTYGVVEGRPELKFVGASEEHGHLFVEGKTTARVGDKLRIIPNHACTCVNMHDTLTAHRGEQIEATWAIAARGKIR